VPTYKQALRTVHTALPGNTDYWHGNSLYEYVHTTLNGI